MIQIGINEDVVLHSVITNDKGTLILGFKEKRDYGEKKTSIFEQAQTAKVESDDRKTELMIFPFKKPDGPKNGGKTDDELLEMISGDISRVKNQLTQLLEQYLKSDDIKWDPYFSTPVNEENYRKEFLDNSTLETMFSNYANQFIEMISPHLADPQQAMRIKLVRQSRDKTFATIPGKFLLEQPWIESMMIPKEASRVAFTKWEIDNGYDSATPVSKKDTDDKAGGGPKTPADTPESKKSIFGGR